MPRLSLFDDTTRESDPRDYCQHHYPRAVAHALDDYGDGVDLDVEHPPYELEDIVCRNCGVPLSDRDN